mgnify:CR=1 FL=1
MKLNKFEFWLMNIPIRYFIQDKLEAKRLRRFSSLSKNKTVLEIGCGEGYGIDLIEKNANTLTVIDKSKHVLDLIKTRHPKTNVLKQNIPPLSNLENDSFDVVISFQVIEHIKDAKLFIKERGEVLCLLVFVI